MNKNGTARVRTHSRANGAITTFTYTGGGLSFLAPPAGRIRQSSRKGAKEQSRRVGRVFDAHPPEQAAGRG
jgi:hypothetical protein